MDKKTFRKKWYFRLLQAIFWGSLIFLIYIGIWAILYEDDMPFFGLIWAGVLIFVYWIIKRIFYYAMFGDRIFGKKTGLISGFILGLLFGILLIIILSIIYPEEDLAGIVIITLLLNGLLFAFAGYLIQNYFGKKNRT